MVTLFLCSIVTWWFCGGSGKSCNIPMQVMLVRDENLSVCAAFWFCRSSQARKPYHICSACTALHYMLLRKWCRNVPLQVSFEEASAPPWLRAAVEQGLEKRTVPRKAVHVPVSIQQMDVR